MFSKELEGLFMLTPEGEIFDSVFPVLQDLLLKLRNVPGSPVIGTSPQSQAGEHGRSFRGTSVGGVEGNDTPRDEVAFLQVNRNLGG